jgi:hypothetical protein
VREDDEEGEEEEEGGGGELLSSLVSCEPFNRTSAAMDLAALQLHEPPSP